jgi:hypothetical protein
LYSSCLVVSPDGLQIIGRGGDISMPIHFFSAVSSGLWRAGLGRRCYQY